MTTNNNMHPPRFGDLPTAKQRNVWQKASSDADWTAAQGPLGPLILKQRSRAFRADKFASWLMGALIVTIFFGLGYYVGVPLWQQVQDGQRHAYLAEADLLANQLQDMDRARDTEWDVLVNQLDLIGTQRESGVSEMLSDILMLPDGKTIVAVGGDRGGNRGVITRSIDGGKTWKVRESGVLSRIVELVSLQEGQTLIAVGEKSERSNSRVITRSADGGETWQVNENVDTGVPSELRVLRDDKTIVALGEFSHEDRPKIIRSTDGGITWEEQEIGDKGDTLVKLIALSDGKTLVAVGGSASEERGRIAHSTDGGESWEVRKSDTTGYLSELILLSDDKTLVATTRSGPSTISFDGGDTWQSLEIGGLGTPYDIHLHSDNKTLFAAGISSEGEHSIITRSEDGGRTWQVRAFDTDSIYEIYELPESQILVAIGTSGLILRSIDGGDTWKRHASGLEVDLFDLVVLPDGKTLVSKGRDFFSATKITRSTDGGDTWQPRATGVAEYLSKVRALPDGHKFIGIGASGAIVLIDDRYKIQLTTAGKIDSGYLGDAKLRELVDNLPAYILNYNQVDKQLIKLNTVIPTEERLRLESQLKRAQAAADQIASGGFSLEQRRDDFASFLKVCREGAAGNEKSSSERVEAKDGVITAKESTERTNVDVTTACSDAYIALRLAETQNAWQILSQRAPQAILLLFLLATLGGLYRYNVRLAGFYHARADALELVQNDDEWTPETLANLGQTLGADKVEFGKSNTPTDQAIEMAKAILSRK